MQMPSWVEAVGITSVHSITRKIDKAVSCNQVAFTLRFAVLYGGVPINGAFAPTGKKVENYKSLREPTILFGPDAWGALADLYL